MTVNKTEIFGTVACLLGVAGVVLNNNRAVECFWLWMVSNAMCMAIHLRVRLWSMAAKDAVFFALAIDGLIRWSS